VKSKSIDNFSNSKKIGRTWFVGTFAAVLILLIVFSGNILRDQLISEDFPLSKQWSLSLQGSIQQLSLAGNQTLLVMTRTKLYALDSTTGDVLWKHDLHWQTITKPALAQNELVFLTDGQGISALDLSDGNLMWQQPVYRAQNAQIAFVSDDFVAVSYRPYLNVYEASTGDLLWSKPVCREAVHPYIYGNTIYIPCYGVTAMDARTGEIVWVTESPDRIWNAGYSDGIMYSSPNRRAVIAYDLESREVLWNTPLKSERVQEFKVAGDFLLLTDALQYCVLRRTDGKIIWCANIGWKMQNPVIVMDIGYIFNGPQTVVYAFDATDGTQIGKLTLARFAFITIYRQLLISSDDMLIFARGDNIFAFGEEEK
jgi:outer membrane protein assembly factor BamB